MIPPTFDDCRTAKYIEAVGTNDLAREPEELCWRAVAITPPPNRFAREKAAPDSYSRRSNPPTYVVPHTDQAFVSSVICWSAFGLASDFGSSSPFLNARIDWPRLSPSSGSLLGPKMTRTTTNTTNRCNG